MDSIPKFARGTVDALQKAYNAGFARAERVCDDLVEVQHSTTNTALMDWIHTPGGRGLVGVREQEVPILVHSMARRIPLQEVVDGTAASTHGPAVHEIGFTMAARIDAAIAEVLETNPIAWDGEHLFAHKTRMGGARTYTNDYTAMTRTADFVDHRLIASDMLTRTAEDGSPLGIELAAVIVPPPLFARARAEIPADVKVIALRFLKAPDLWYAVGAAGKVKPFFASLRSAPECLFDNSRWDLIVHAEPRMGVCATLPHLFTRCRVKGA